MFVLVVVVVQLSTLVAISWPTMMMMVMMIECVHSFLAAVAVCHTTPTAYSASLKTAVTCALMSDAAAEEED